MHSLARNVVLAVALVAWNARSCVAVPVAPAPITATGTAVSIPHPSGTASGTIEPIGTVTALPPKGTALPPKGSSMPSECHHSGSWSHHPSGMPSGIAKSTGLPAGLSATLPLPSGSAALPGPSSTASEPILPRAEMESAAPSGASMPTEALPSGLPKPSGEHKGGHWEHKSHEGGSPTVKLSPSATAFEPILPRAEMESAAPSSAVMPSGALPSGLPKPSGAHKGGHHCGGGAGHEHQSHEGGSPTAVGASPTAKLSPTATASAKLGNAPTTTPLASAASPKRRYVWVNELD